MPKLCKKCIYKNRDDCCMVKNLNVCEIKYKDCWFFNDLSSFYEEDEENTKESEGYY